ncbi:MAG TPA: succinate dehydrogenase, cytochrome b556 subunit [Methylotenera sp.]|nr:succinate dehydrogenase, cytochrome b556 subunit [Methylotenera sp.]HPH05217.1 succinate dehydrogenase, cytochrome b556 subunit [Methylotenera sp.]HPN00119.1 succinate dehydrogenase, cytochrome b556 subunit [Methylotenera sp.]
MKKIQAKNRPKNLNLLTIRLPINAVVSILHRASGVFLFLALPLFLLAFQASVHSAKSYAELADLLDGWFIKLVLIGLSWAFFHHFFAGIRHLLQDVHWMTSLQKARFSSRVVLWLVGFSVLTFAVCIW